MQSALAAVRECADVPGGNGVSVNSEQPWPAAESTFLSETDCRRVSVHLL